MRWHGGSILTVFAHLKALKSQRSRSDGVAKMLPSMHLNEESTPWNIGTPGVGLGSAAGPQRSSLSSQRSSIAAQLVNPSLGGQQSVGPGSIHLSNNQTPKRTCHSNPVYLLLSDLGRNETTQSTSPSKGIRIVLIRFLIGESLQSRASRACLCSPGSVLLGLANLTSYGAYDSDRGNSHSDDAGSSKLKLGSPPHQRGVPDGCTLESERDNEIDLIPSTNIANSSTLSSIFNSQPSLTSSASTISSTASDTTQKQLLQPQQTASLFVKKGWLYLRQRYNGQIEWTRMWFVLRNNSLCYFNDSVAEEKGHPNGVIDLGALRAATEIENTDRNYAFAVVW